jgi:predicted Zn-ribbon and HTH transcriptional regulator
MAKIKRTVEIYQCERCDHEWQKRGKLEPEICPKCKSAYWNRPKNIEETEEKQ